MSPRKRPIVYALLAFVAVWLLAIIGYALANHAKVTPEKIRAYMQANDLRKLQGQARADAIRELADKLNRLSPEERRQARIGRLSGAWFEAMTEEEKSAFLDATLPTSFKQAITAFENLPQEKRQKALENAIKRLRQAREQSDSARASSGQTNNVTSTNGQPVLSEQLQQKIVMTGLKSFYTQSSAQSKAELAPLLEEIQQTMKSGRLFR